MLAVSVVLVALIIVITFSDNSVIPNWQGIYNILTGKTIATEDDMVKFIDVGQGDSILISSQGYNCLVDFGNESSYGQELLGDLKDCGVNELDCVILTHYDTDHAGGAARVITGIKTHYALMPEQHDRSETVFNDLQYALEESGTKVSFAKAGTVVNIGNFEITVLAYGANEEDENDRSIVLMVKNGDKKFLLTGDAGAGVEKTMLDDRINVDCDVYKAAHHGSRNSNSKEFVEAASPTYAVYSVGASNQYGHPHEEVTEILENAGAKIYTTAKHGDVTFYIKDGELSVETDY